MNPSATKYAGNTARADAPVHSRCHDLIELFEEAQIAFVKQTQVIDPVT